MPSSPHLRTSTSGKASLTFLIIPEAFLRINLRNEFMRAGLIDVLEMDTLISEGEELLTQL